MKKLVFVILIGLLFVTACEQGNTKKTVKTQKGQIHEHCVRNGKIDDVSSTDLSYELYYTGERINKIESTEMVISSNSKTLDEYEKAYRQIHSYYVDIDHYDTQVIRTNDKVVSKMIIDYDRIDIDALIALEGEEDNIFENKVPKISKYRDFAKKMGITCEVVS